MICRLCEKNDVRQIIDFGRQPIVHNLLRNPEDACDLYPFRLGKCETCGFLQLMDCIPPEILYQDYFTLSGWKQQPHISKLLRLVETVFNTDRHSAIIEIGCNDGSFLEHLRSRGYDRLLGIEPTSDSYQIAQSKGFDVLNNFFSYEKAVDLVSLGDKFDLVIARQVLEHIADLDNFLKGIRKVLKNSGNLLLEIPDSSIHVDYLDYSFWEEHVNYFTLHTVTNLLAKHGFSILHSESIKFSGLALIVLAKKSSFPQKQSAPALNKIEVERMLPLEHNWPSFKHAYQANLNSLKEKGREIAVFGCGCRSSTIVNFLSIGAYLACYIDDRKEKQNHYVPGNFLPIYSRESLQTQKINHVILGVNAENEEKVIQANRFNENRISFESVLPPSMNLPEFWREVISK